jgi:hypothetical protein
VSEPSDETAFVLPFQSAYTATDRIVLEPDATRMPSQDMHGMNKSLHLPIEVVELIIDKVPDGQTFISCSLVCREWLARCRYYLFARIKVAAGSCGEVFPYLSGPSKAGHFVQSLVITETSPDLLGTVASTSANGLMQAVPNVRELQMFGVTEWALEHFLDPLANQIEDLTLVHVRVSSWAIVRNRLARCSEQLRCIRISSLHFRPIHKTTSMPRRLSYASQTDDPIPFKLPQLERIAIESEASAFANDLLQDIVSSASTSRVQFVELPLPLPNNALLLLSSIGSTLTNLIIHCETLRAAPDLPSTFIAVLPFTHLTEIHLEHLNFNINACKSLASLHIVGMSGNGVLAVTALAGALRRFPYSTLRELQLGFRGPSGYYGFMIEDWRALDDTLSLPHMASLERIEFVGFFGSTSTLAFGKRLPQTHARRIIRVLG